MLVPGVGGDDGFACGAASSFFSGAVVIRGEAEFKVWRSGYRMGRVAREHGYA